MKTREIYKSNSNNPDNPNKNWCAIMVTATLGVNNKVRYLHTIQDIVRATRKSYIVRSRKSSVKGYTVGSIRNQLKSLGADYYIIRTNRKDGTGGHVILLNSKGTTIEDTCPRKKDKRIFSHIYGVWKKDNQGLW